MTQAFIASSLGMIASNYIYQFFCSHPDWGVATERSFFQLAALAMNSQQRGSGHE
jgi:hypothetical protein